MDHKKLEQQIRKTGFVLENKIAQALKRNGWSVISNKYYEDDLEDSVREIDLIAYKASKVQHFMVCTTLVVSCKKSEANAWAFLSRDANANDPNTDYWSLHVWSNDKALSFKFAESGAGQRYYERAIALGVKDALARPSVEVFAFQEMNTLTGAPQNDKPIFSTITSLMKAQAYELGALSQRKKEPCIYQFNLMSVVDAPMVRLMFKGDDIASSEIESEHYLARYIVKKKETCARIRFIRSTVFDDILNDYSKLHLVNTKLFDESCDQFFENIVRDSTRFKILFDDFKVRIQHRVDWTASSFLQKNVKVDIYSLYWKEADSCLVISIDTEEGVDGALNNNPATQQRVREALLIVYRYSGLFTFDGDIPF